MNEKIPAKIVCVRNKRNKKEWIAFISTNPDISEEEIIRIYGKRWQIEVFFKPAKRIWTWSVNAIVFPMMHWLHMSPQSCLPDTWEQRHNEDDRELGEPFCYFMDELADITFGESFQIIITAMLDSMRAIFQPTEEQLQLFIDMFIGGFPEYVRNSLAKAALEAWNPFWLPVFIEFLRFKAHLGYEKF